MPPTRRPGLSALLVGGALVLVVSILIGQKLGDRVLLQTARPPLIGGGGVTPVPGADAPGHDVLKNWKRLQVISVATDPAFPDPRVTPPPMPSPQPYTPPPRHKTPAPAPTKAPTLYTSPPLPIPLVSHEPTEVETEPPTLPPP